MRFKDPTFVDMVVRRRANYKIANPDNKTRLCYLFADAITRNIQGDTEGVLAIQRWVGETAPHIMAHDTRGVSEMYRVHALDIVARGWGYCEATSELFATLCWLAGYPARILSIQQKMEEPVSGHHVNEVFIEGKWRFIDADLYRCFRMPDGELASALDLHHHPEIVRESEARRRPEDFPDELIGAKYVYQDEAGNPTYQDFFSVIYVQEGLYSLDESYGRWLKYTPQTEEYLYGSPQHPDVQRLLSGRLPFTYVRGSTQVADHFHHPWDVDWQSWSEE